jgi:molybdate transport system regulatory protein
MPAKAPVFRPKKPPRLSHHPETGYSVQGRVWLEKDGELYIGWGRVILLERIQKYGSIAAAAKSMKLGYRNAWLWLEAMNRLAPAALVEKVIGGAGGGHTRLTEEGQRVIDEYKRLRARFNDFLKSV